MILRYIMYGEQDEVIDNKTVWCCTTCHICEERCPHEIRILGLLTYIRNLAAKRGNLPDSLRAGIKLMSETGWAIPATSSAARVREELGLNPLKQPDTNEIKKIFCEAGLDKILELE
jgi:heterodisulfide reductase subunit C